jgi:hypothetical protein
MKHPRFVQIACSVSDAPDSALRENLYVLDAGGNVWFYDFNQCVWIPLADEDEDDEHEGDENDDPDADKDKS